MGEQAECLHIRNTDVAARGDADFDKKVHGKRRCRIILTRPHPSHHTSTQSRLGSWSIKVNQSISNILTWNTELQTHHCQWMVPKYLGQQVRKSSPNISHLKHLFKVLFHFSFNPTVCQARSTWDSIKRRNKATSYNPKW